MLLDLFIFAKKIRDKGVKAAAEGEQAPLGNKIRRKNIGEILAIGTVETNDARNLEYYVLRLLSKGEYTYAGIQKQLKITHENARWHIVRKNNSLEKLGFAKSTSPIGRLERWNITENGLRALKSLRIITRRPKRTELLIQTTKGVFVLSSWWSSWIAPKQKIKSKFVSSESRVFWRVPEGYIYLYRFGKDGLMGTLLPRFIEISDEQLVATLGLLKGEMMLEKGKISFVNTDGRLINYVLDCFEKFRLARADWEYGIEINTRDKDQNDSTLRKHWSTLLSVPEAKFSRITRYPEYGSKRGDFGRVVTVYKNTLFREVFDEIMSSFIDEAKRNKEYAIYFLRGLLAAEGWVRNNSKGKLKEIGIGSHSKSNMDAYRELLQSAGINGGHSNWNVCIYGKDDFELVKQLDLLKISKDKLKIVEG